MSLGLEVYSAGGALQYSAESNGVFFFASVTLLAGQEGELVYPELMGRRIVPVAYPINGGLSGFGTHPDLDMPISLKFHMLQVDNSRGAIKFFYGSQGGWWSGSPNWWKEVHPGVGASYLDIYVSGAHI